MEKSSKEEGLMKILFLFFLLLYPQQGWSKAQCPAGLTQQQCCNQDPRGATLTSCDNSCGTCTGGYYAGCFKCTGASHDTSLDAASCATGCQRCTSATHCTRCEVGYYMNSYDCFKCPANAYCDGYTYECYDGYEYNSSSKSCVKSTKSSYDIYYRDAVWTSNTQKNSTPVQASSLSEAASAIQTAWAPKYATCSGNSSANTVSCTCDTGEAGVQYFWLGSNCITFASSHPGVCYKAGTYYSSYDSSGSPGNDCNTAYEECPADCAACTASGGVQCTRCKSGYYIYNGECVSSCPSGYAPENGECVEAAEDPDPMSGSCPSPLKLSSDGCCCVK